LISYLVSMGVFAGVYALMALGLNVAWGWAGMANLGLVGFYGIGAYASALSTTRLGWPILGGVALAMACAAAAGAAFAMLTARLRGDYLAIVTLGFAEVVRLVAATETRLTGGIDGVPGIPGPGRAALGPIGFNMLMLGITWACVIMIGLLLARLGAAPWGRVLRAIREDETVAAVSGHLVLGFKLQAFAVGAGVLGLAGALSAHYTSYIAPDALGAVVTLQVVLALTAGGTGRVAGAVLGAGLVVLLTEGSRFLSPLLPLSAVQFAASREIAVAAALLVLLHMRPAGILPERHRVYPGRSTGSQ